MEGRDRPRQELARLAEAPMEEVAAKAGKAPPRARELAAALPALPRQSLTRKSKTQTTARAAQWARECRDLVGRLLQDQRPWSF